MTLAPGIHDGIPADAYHADPGETPTLSASIAKVLCARSPAHARARHPRLNPDYQPLEDTKFDKGTVAHAMLLQGDDICHVVHANDWRTNAAKAERDQARFEGFVPLLSHQHAEVSQMVAAAREQIAAIDDPIPFLADGKPEQTAVWEDQGVLCRGRFDWLRDDFRAIDDVKTTGASGHPNDWSRRRLWDLGFDIQAVMYRRALRRLTGTEPRFRWIVIETEAPYAVSVLELAPDALEFAEDKVRWALRTWADCLSTNAWPGYADRVAYAEAPPWELERWNETRALDRHLEEVRAA